MTITPQHKVYHHQRTQYTCIAFDVIKKCTLPISIAAVSYCLKCAKRQRYYVSNTQSTQNTSTQSATRAAKCMHKKCVSLCDVFFFCYRPMYVTPTVFRVGFRLQEFYIFCLFLATRFVGILMKLANIYIFY